MKHFIILTLTSLTASSYAGDVAQQCAHFSHSITPKSSSLFALSSTSKTFPCSAPLSSASGSPVRMGLAVTVAPSSSMPPATPSMPLGITCSLTLASPHPQIDCTMNIFYVKPWEAGCSLICPATALEQENKRLHQEIASQRRQLYALKSLLSKKK